MPQDTKSITLTLTPEQQERVRQATGKVTDTLEFSIMELEERIAPGARGTGNSLSAGAGAWPSVDR
jgi:hypothetical protein